jgi:multidrug efflux pump
MRRDGLYTMDVKANVAKEKGVLVDDKVKELDNWLKAQNWPDNVYFRFRGADEEQQKSAAFLQKAMFGSLFLMFIILVTQFNSFYQTILTLSTVIMSVFGVLIGMMLTGQKFSIIMTGTGVVALAGIVVNNAIVLIDTYNRMREEGIEPIEAILKTSAQRIRPILLTTITTIAGLIPMATQINFDFIERVVSMGSITAIWWIQLSTAVISGLAFSTILTLVVIPIMLVAPHVWSQAFANLWRRIVLMFTRLFGRRSKSVAPAPALADAAAGVAVVAQAESQPPMIPANDPTPLPTVPSSASAKPKPKVRKPKPPGVPLQDAAE